MYTNAGRLFLRHSPKVYQNSLSDRHFKLDTKNWQMPEAFKENLQFIQARGILIFALILSNSCSLVSVPLGWRFLCKTCRVRIFIEMEIVARTKSVGSLRCIPSFPCHLQQQAIFSSLHASTYPGRLWDRTPWETYHRPRWPRRRHRLPNP